VCESSSLDEDIFTFENGNRQFCSRSSSMFVVVAATFLPADCAAE
jgi:hypothetical protein